MNFFFRAAFYVKRKWKKILLLAGVFIVTAVTILGAWEILSMSGRVAASMKKESGSKITLESTQTDLLLNNDDVEQLGQIGNVDSCNRVTAITAHTNGFLPVAGADDGDIVSLHGYDDMSKDSPFEEMICRIVDGREATADGEVVINQRLADVNGICLNDEVSFVCGNETRTATVVGMYLTGNEDSQTKAVLTENRIENQIYTTNDIVFQLGNEGDYEKVAAYVVNPDELEDTKASISEMLGNKASISVLDTAWQKIKSSLNGMVRITKLILVLILATGIFVIGSLLILQMRNRKAEIAVFISLGISRLEIIAQTLTEILIVWSSSVAVAALLGMALFPKLGAWIETVQSLGVKLSTSVYQVFALWGIGGAVLVIFQMVSLTPLFLKKPKEILSEMED